MLCTRPPATHANDTWRPWYPCTTIRAPWAHLLMLGVIEHIDRREHTEHRGALCIHAAAHLFDEELNQLSQRQVRALRAHGWLTRHDLPTGQILGTAQLAACQPTGNRHKPWRWTLHSARFWQVMETARGDTGIWDAHTGIELARDWQATAARAAEGSRWRYQAAEGGIRPPNGAEGIA